MFQLPKYKYYFAVSDYLILLLSIMITAYIFLIKVPTNAANSKILITVYVLALLPLIILAAFHFNNLYKVNVILSKSRHYTYLIRSFILSFLPISILTLVAFNEDLVSSIIFSVLFTFTSLGLLYVIRVKLLSELYLLLRINKFKRNILIVGDGETGKMLAAKLILENSVGINITGFVHESIPIGEIVIGDIPVIGRISDLPRIANELNIEEAIVAYDEISPDKLFNLIDYCKQYVPNTNITSQIVSIISQKVPVEKYSDIPIVELHGRTNTKFERIIKRAFDILVSLICLILLLPFFILVALLIKIDSKGPVIFKQIRVGKDGKLFSFLKFRTMTIQNGEDVERKEDMLKYMQDESLGTKIVNDKRITKVGKYLRKYSIDELPQFYNVLIGEMSLVGPRPCLPYEYENYENWQKRRTRVTPGCTCIWQVVGRSSVTFKESIILDLYYISNMSFWLDIQLILKTIPVVLLGRGGK